MADPVVNDLGKTLTEINPVGQVEIGGKAYTAELSVLRKRDFNPIPANTPIRVRSWFVGQGGEKVYVVGTLVGEPVRSDAGDQSNQAQDQPRLPSPPNIEAMAIELAEVKKTLAELRSEIGSLPRGRLKWSIRLATGFVISLISLIVTVGVWIFILQSPVVPEAKGFATISMGFSIVLWICLAEVFARSQHIRLDH